MAAYRRYVRRAQYMGFRLAGRNSERMVRERRRFIIDKDVVAHLLRDSYRLESLAAGGSIDAADVLFDLERAINAADLTLRQRDVLFYMYGVGVTQEEAASLLGVSQATVSELLDAAVTKIAEVYQRWEDEERGGVLSNEHDD